MKPVILGVITGSHGIKGWVKIKSFTADPADIVRYAPLRTVSGERELELSLKGETKGLLLASVQGITDRNAAEALRGVELCVPRDRLPPPEEDEYFIEDLVGLTVTTESGEPVGQVKAVLNFGAGDIVEIVRTEGGEEMYAFTHANFPTVDMTAGTITFRTPDLLTATDDTAP